jgi:hypothetical protein
MHYQSVWEERSNDTGFPLWTRIAMLAFARHKANGHAIFPRGGLALIMGKPTPEGFKSEDRSNIQRAIRMAISRGWLDPASCTECLIVPSHAITGGLGSATERCSVHDRKAELRRRTTAA